MRVGLDIGSTTIKCVVLNDAGQIVGNPKLQEAYEMGKNV